jgi:hypothetical protein
MAESAYPHGFPAPILEYDYGDSLNIVQAIEAELQAIGIRAQIKAVPLSAWASVEFGPSAKRMTNFATGGCVDPDPSNFVGYNLGSWNVQPGGEDTANYAPPAWTACGKPELPPPTHQHVFPFIRSCCGSCQWMSLMCPFTWKARTPPSPTTSQSRASRSTRSTAHMRYASGSADPRCRRSQGPKL